MKNNLFRLALLCALFAAGTEYSFGQTSSLKVLSFNIRYNNTNDGENSWPNRSERVKNFLWSESADIIGFQEVLHNEVVELDRALFNYNFSQRQYIRVGVGREEVSCVNFLLMHSLLPSKVVRCMAHHFI
jgi:hypothetical protein